MKQLRRRDAVQVAYHWINFLAIVSLGYSGLAIYFGASGTADYFVWHLWAAWVLVAALAIHVWHTTITLKRFGRMWVTRDDLQSGLARLRNILQRQPQVDEKHRHYKLEQIAYHWVMAGTVFGLVITGLMLWKPARVLVGPFWLPWGWDAIFAARLLHDIFTIVLLVLIAAHVYFAICVPQNWYLLKSIFNGKVQLSRYAEHHRISPRLESELEEVKPSTEASSPSMPAGEGLRSTQT